jgi:hypothetical protein
MRRFVTLAVLLLLTIPFGASLSGCKGVAAPDFCNGSDSGPVTGQLTTLTLQPQLTGVSLNQGQIGQVSSPSSADCKGRAAAVSSFTYGTTDMTLADVNPVNGQLCAGTWNRNQGGGIADYTTCNATGKSGTAYITASADGVSSNPIPVFVHPIVTSIVLYSPPGATIDCKNNPTINCPLDPTQANGCVNNTAYNPNSGTPAPPPIYTGGSCISQGSTAQFSAQIFSGTAPNLNNISCQIGPLSFIAQNSAVVSIATQTALNASNQIYSTSIATAVQPGTTIISANISQSSSSAGLFSTCPPKSIALSVANTGATSTVIDQNSTQNLTATVIDTNGNPLNNLSLEYVSTTPTTIATAGSSITPAFPGSASITAICQPPYCNPAPFNQIGLFGTGLPVVSNPVAIASPGSNSTVLYIGSTQSQYIVPVDFTTNTLGSAVRLPFAPNSMVIGDNLATIYMGTSTGLMTFSALNNAYGGQDTSVSGPVLSVSPDSGTVVITDPVRKLVYLYNASGSIASEIGGVGTRASWSPDSATVYITTSTGQILVHNILTGWTTLNDAAAATSTDVAVTVPSQGAYFGGPVNTTARTICPTSTVTGANGSQTVSNTFYPIADSKPYPIDRLVTTNSGTHLLGATQSTEKLYDFLLTLPTSCPAAPAPGQTFNSAINAQPPLNVVASAITSVLTTSDSAFGFVTYTGTGGTVPQYNIATHTLANVPLATTAGSPAPVAPVAGTLSADDQTLYLGTTADNLVHILTRGATGFTDSRTIAPVLPGLTGGTATPNLLVQRPRKSTT